MRSDDRIAPLGGPHLTDDQLMEAYVVSAENPHVAGCRQCRSRLDDLSRVLEQVREDAMREADSLFEADRLREQRDRILRRLERQEHPGEVVMFPSRSADPQTARRVFGPARRWVAAGAAAGLAAGLFLGFAMDRRVTSRARTGALAVPVSTVTAWQPTNPQDEQMLREIEDDLIGQRRVFELRALDAMTFPPELQEVSLELR